MDLKAALYRKQQEVKREKVGKSETESEISSNKKVSEKVSVLLLHVAMYVGPIPMLIV